MRKLLKNLVAASLVVVFVMMQAPALAAQQAPLTTSIAETSNLTPLASETAELLGILPQVKRLIDLKHERGSTGATMSDEELTLKVDVLDKILGASLEVRMLAGRIDRELAWAFAGRGAMESQRQKYLNYLFTANFIQGGILGVLSGPAFLNGHPKTGTEFLLVASSVGLGLSTLALIEARRGSKTVDGGPTILANVFDVPVTTQPIHQFVVVNKYLRTAAPGTNKSRVQTLIDNWKTQGYLHSVAPQNLQVLSAVQPTGQHYKENIGILSNRIRMLFDTQYTIESMHEGLVELLRATDVD